MRTIKVKTFLAVFSSGICLLSCGSKRGEQKNQQPETKATKVVPRADTDADAKKVTSDKETTRNHRFEFTFPGIEGVIKGQLLPEYKMRLDDFNNAFKFMLKINPAMSNIKITDDHCTEIKIKLSTFAAASDFRRELIGIDVRQDSNIRAYIEALLIPTIDGHFENAAWRAAQKAYPEANFAKLEQKLSYEKPILSIEAQPDALIQQIGKIEALTSQLNLFEVNPYNGRMNGRIMAQDLLCDIYSGKAHLQYKLKSNYGTETTSVSEGVE